MSHYIGWHDTAQTIVRQIYDGRVKRYDFERMVCESRRLLQSVPHAVDLFIEWQGEGGVMQDLSAISVAMFAERHVPDNQRFIFMIHAPLTYRALVSAFQRSVPRATRGIYFVDTTENAYRLRTMLLDAHAITIS